VVRYAPAKARDGAKLSLIDGQYNTSTFVEAKATYWSFDVCTADLTSSPVLA